MAEKQVAQGVFNSQKRDETGRTATQRGSLKQVNATLLAQTDVLRDTQQSILSTNNLLTKSLQGQLKAASMERLKDLEKQREGGRFKAVAGGIGAAGGKVVDSAKSGLGSLGGMLGKLGGFLTPAALAALPGVLGGILLKRGIPALAVGIFADEIAEFLLGPEASGELKDQVTRAIQGGALGSLLGKKFALIGAAAGFLIDDEVAKQLLEVGKSFGTLIGADITNLNDLKGMMESIGKFLRENLKSGLEGINKLLNGEIASFFGIDGKEGGGNVLSTLGLLSGLGMLFAPATTLKVGLAATIGSLQALWGVGGYVLKGLGSLVGLGNSIGDAGVMPGGPGRKGAKPPAKFPGFAMKGGNLVMAGASFLGPIGLVVASGALLAGLGVAVAAAASEKAERERYEGAGVDYAGPGFEKDVPDLMSTEFGEEPTYLGTEAERERLKLYDLSKDGLSADRFKGTLGFRLTGYTTEERQQAKQVEIEAEKYLRMLKRPAYELQEPDWYKARNQSAMGANQPVVVDGSTNTTNNIGQSNTTLSAPPPSAGQRDDYSNALQSRGDDLMMSAAG